VEYLELTIPENICQKFVMIFYINNYAIRRIILSPSFDTDGIIYFVSDEEIFRSVNGGETCARVKKTPHEMNILQNA
jgi:hypothetical protein